MRTLRIFIALSAISFLLVPVGCGPDTEEDSSDPVLLGEDDGGDDSGFSSGRDAGSQTGGSDVESASSTDSGETKGDTDEDPTSDSGPSTDTGTPNDAGHDAETTPSPDEVDPQCLDGQYSEPLPDQTADISSAKANYSSSNLKGFLDAVLDARYPVGKWIVDGGIQNYDRANCVQEFTRDTSSADGVIGDLSTVVHECGHFFDRGKSGFDSSWYGFTPNTTFECSGGNSMSPNNNPDGETFARSRIRNDQYQPKHPPCEETSSNDCDRYADIYLDGNPDDGNFDGGDQGFNMLLEEAVQYVNSLATSYAFEDHIRGSTSALDGILTFLWYTERYLRMARLDYPAVHDKLTQDPCWRKAILTMWGRAWLLIDKAESHDSLGIRDSKLFSLVRDPDLLKEIDRVRQAHGCP